MIELAPPDPPPPASANATNASSEAGTWLNASGASTSAITAGFDDGGGAVGIVAALTAAVALLAAGLGVLGWRHRKRKRKKEEQTEPELKRADGEFEAVDASGGRDGGDEREQHGGGPRGGGNDDIDGGAPPLVVEELSERSEGLATGDDSGFGRPELEGPSEEAEAAAAVALEGAAAFPTRSDDDGDGGKATDGALEAAGGPSRSDGGALNPAMGGRVRLPPQLAGDGAFALASDDAFELDGTPRFHSEDAASDNRLGGDGGRLARPADGRLGNEEPSRWGMKRPGADGDPLDLEGAPGFGHMRRGGEMDSSDGRLNLRRPDALAERVLPLGVGGAPTLREIVDGLSREGTPGFGGGVGRFGELSADFAPAHPPPLPMEGAPTPSSIVVKETAGAAALRRARKARLEARTSHCAKAFESPRHGGAGSVAGGEQAIGTAPGNCSEQEKRKQVHQRLRRATFAGEHGSTRESADVRDWSGVLVPDLVRSEHDGRATSGDRAANDTGCASPSGSRFCGAPFRRCVDVWTAEGIAEPRDTVARAPKAAADQPGAVMRSQRCYGSDASGEAVSPASSPGKWADPVSSPYVKAGISESTPADASTP